MSSVKEKLAALRAKRTAQKSVSQPTDALSAAALALGRPQVSWDADYKVKLEDHDSPQDVRQTVVSSCSSDEDDDQLVVLPPPTRKLNPAAQRQLWRMREIERAREKAARNLMENLPSSFDVDETPIEQCSEEPNAADGSEDGAQEHPEGDDDEEDEEEAALHQQESAQFGEGDDPEQDEEEAALETAQRIEEEELVDAQDELALCSASNAQKELPESVTGKPTNDEALPRQPPWSSELVRSASRGGHGLAEEKNGTGAEQETNDLKASEGVSKSVHIDSCSSGAKAVISDVIQSRKRDCFEDSSKPAIIGSFEEKRFSTGFVEEEADEDEDGGNEKDFLQVQEDSSEASPPACAPGADGDEDDDGIEHENIDSSDNKKLAAFHQKWILEKERDDLNAMKKDPGRMIVDDMDDAMDLTELAHAPATDNQAETDNASEAGEGIHEDDAFVGADHAKSNNYVDEMFLRDDSRSKFLEDEDDADEENEEDNTNRREKARALWKARQKTKINLFQEDENSLSRFDIFGDTDKSRSEHFRMKLESACRSISKNGMDDRSRADRDHRGANVKRTNPWSSERLVPEWEKRNACLQQKQRKRQRSVSVGKWSFAAHGEKEKAPSKASKFGYSGPGNTSLGSTYLARKPRSHAVLTKRNRASSTGPSRKAKHSPSKGPTSFKNLLSVLGERAESDL